ncbi:Glutamate--tRNA ligase 1 [Rubripirellula obstinata]|uniref:Glutamate--tRNA ligase 1 n=1 Tax=Rubripirellula obstinata TaxID=406547 RepID=A0A5B1CIM4_9BACT|nr:tRNA glutamyl-Q(34) synthetase GluQRS [Rubripirellula obstinata]KAA1259765.1 Glutamate--tRNA ligase 1 [Rubripirellula obstinata]
MNAGRLAPSPTGAQHLGNARTYLLAYWSARSTGIKETGKKLILRIEDVDSPRVKPWAMAQAIEDLRWIGIDWDEGPFIQTERLDLYQKALDRLIQANQVFPCTCTRKDIEEAGSAPHFDHEPKIYPGTCSCWQTGDPIPETGSFSWRFRAADHMVSFNDLVLGTQSCNPAKDLGDFPITQKNGSPSYQLAVVVDDALMGITEVVRGNDLIASAFRQIELFNALGYSPPTFAHVPLVLGPDGRRLAKRHGDTRLSTYREQGIAPERIVQWAIESTQIDPANFDWQDLNRDDVTLDF